MYKYRNEMIDSFKRAFVSFGYENNFLFVLKSENYDLPVLEHVFLCGRMEMCFTEKHHRFIFFSISFF